MLRATLCIFVIVFACMLANSSAHPRRPRPPPDGEGRMALPRGEDLPRPPHRRGEGCNCTIDEDGMEGNFILDGDDDRNGNFTDRRCNHTDSDIEDGDRLQHSPRRPHSLESDEDTTSEEDNSSEEDGARGREGPGHEFKPGEDRASDEDERQGRGGRGPRGRGRGRGGPGRGPRIDSYNTQG